jgi:hypothetical protein
MFSLSTSDYNVSRGYRSSSPLSSDEDRAQFIRNQKAKRNAIELALSKLPPEEKHRLRLYLKCDTSDYVPQEFQIILSRNNYEKGYEEYSFVVDAEVYPEIWKDFDDTPFIQRKGLILRKGLKRQL